MTGGLWTRVHELLDRGVDPRTDERVLELLGEQPERAGELAALMAGLDELPAARRRARWLPFAAAGLAAAALLLALVRLDANPSTPAPAPPAVRLLSFRAELLTEGPGLTRRHAFELDGGRLRERGRHVERTLHDPAGAAPLRIAWRVETP